LAGGITREWLDELRSRNDIVATISRYLPLERKGRQYWGRCPFHHEKTPSFAVDEVRQFYHCFGCGASGDVIKFIQLIEHVEFMDAVKMLAEQAGMEVPEYRASERDDTLKKKRDAMIEINRLAARHYHENLMSPNGADAYKYLTDRGITPSMIKKFGLGLSLDYNDLVRYLAQNKVDLDLAVEGGLLGVSQKNNRHYDVFGTRLIFPIINSYGDVVAFGGRTLQKDYDGAKYRNTGATFLFDKSVNIYAINLIKKLKLKKSVDSLILCEGYVDVIALHQAGFDNAVASMGTALTKEQCRILARFAKTVYISYDGDGAGQKATMRGLELLVDAGLEVKVISLPDGLDPDDVIKRRGAPAYQRLIDEALPFFEYKIKKIAAGYNLKAYDGRTKFATAACEEIKKLENKIEQERYVRMIVEMTGFSQDSLMRQIGAHPSPKSDGVKTVPTDERIYSAEEKAARYLLYAFINRFPFATSLPDGFAGFLGDELSVRIYEAFTKDPTLTVSSAYGVLDEGLHGELARVADDDQNIAPEQAEQYYKGCWKLLEKLLIKRQINDLSIDFGNAMTKEDKNEILRSIMLLDKKLKDLD